MTDRWRDHSSGVLAISSTFSPSWIQEYLRWPIYEMHKYFFPVHNIHLFSAQNNFWVHKSISQCTNIFFSAQIYFWVHKSISQCTNVFLSAQIYFSVYKCISQCTNIFFSAQIYFSVHKSISQCTNVFLSAQIFFSVHVKSQCIKVASMKSVICQDLTFST